jgi:hypothetical protein
VFVRARIGDNAIKPVIAANSHRAIDARKQLKEDLLSDIVGHRLVAAVMNAIV